MPAQKDIESLLEDVGRGDREAFDHLYRALEKPVYRFILLKLNDPFRSADILHDVFLDVWRNAGKFQGRSTARTWVFAIAYRKVVDVYRRESRTVVTDEVPETEDGRMSAEMSMIASQQDEAVRACLGTLKADHRTAIELIFFEDMNYADAAEVIGVPEGTVKSRVYHARQLLARCLGHRLKPGKE